MTAHHPSFGPACLSRHSGYGFPIFALRGALDFADAASILEPLAGAARAGHKRLCLDLSQVSSLDAATARLLVTFRRWVHDHGNRCDFLDQTPGVQDRLDEAEQALAQGA